MFDDDFVLLVLISLCVSMLTLGILFQSAPKGATLSFRPGPAHNGESAQNGEPAPTYQQAMAVSDFGKSVEYKTSDLKPNPEIAKNFDMSEVKNLADMEEAYGVKFSADEKKLLADRKFVLKKVTDTSIEPSSEDLNPREFVALYDVVNGAADARSRTPANAVFYSADVFFNTYNNLYTELLKEMENATFYPAIRSLSEKFYQDAAANLAAAKADTDRNTWLKVRNYFAVPYAIFTTAAQPLTRDDYYKDGVMLDPQKVQDDFKAKDASVDTEEHVAQFIKDLHLDADSEARLLKDVSSIYQASDASAPKVFADEYIDYAEKSGVGFDVDFTQFTPRGAYTSSSLRRQYFRGMKWYIFVPFFLGSDDLTTYAFAITDLMAKNTQALQDYNKLESAINFMVGSTDDLMPVDYLLALEAGKGQADPSKAAMDYLIKAHAPKIKDLGATYQDAGTEQTAEVLLKSKSMRFFGGKFILDSYWTGQLTQGDEALKPGYTQKLPPMASSLEVMTLLGSDYAESQIPTLDFYSDLNDQAIAQAIKELKAETAAMTEEDWRSNLYTSWLWTIRSLFSWQKANQSALPRFMQTPAWAVKTLQTASGWWTELRHATILYAKQSFAEKGGGGYDGCDDRMIPEAPKGYIEPQLEAYNRLAYLAKRTMQGLQDQGYELQNMKPLQGFIDLLDQVQTYVQKELGNQKLAEQTKTNTFTDEDGQACTEYAIDGVSDWETLRVGLVEGLIASLPVPTEGPVLPAKDRRAALVADVHTGGDSSYEKHILYEAEGVPYVIFTAVKDANGPRLTVGFIYSQYEFTELYGGKRKTDEDWQKNFYEGDEIFDAFHYTDAKTWPKVNTWYQSLFKSQ